MNLFKTTLLGCVASLALTSCLGDGDQPNQTISYSLKYNYSYVTDLDDDTAAPLLLAGGEYEFNYNATKATVTLTVENLQLSTTGSRNSFLLSDIPFSVAEDGAINFKVTNAVSENSALTISNLSVRQIGVAVNSTQSAMYYDISFVVDSRWSVRVIQRNNIFAGKRTTTKIGTTDKDEVTYDSSFGYSIDLDKKTAIVALTGVRYGDRYFSEINFDDLSYTVSGTAITFAPGAKTVALDYAGKPISDFNITDFSAYLTYAPELVFSFTINGDTRMSCIGTYRNVKED